MIEMLCFKSTRGTGFEATGQSSSTIVECIVCTIPYDVVRGNWSGQGRRRGSGRRQREWYFLGQFFRQPFGYRFGFVWIGQALLSNHTNHFATKDLFGLLPFAIFPFVRQQIFFVDLGQLAATSGTRFWHTVRSGVILPFSSNTKILITTVGQHQLIEVIQIHGTTSTVGPSLCQFGVFLSETALE